MTDQYDDKSCNALERPFYRPVEAALRWCNLSQQEGRILQALGDDHIPRTGQFPMWPCLQANTEKILDAISHGEIAYGRDGKTVPAGEQVARPRLTVRHTDLREWMAKYHPGSKPAFLFDEVEQNTHAAINADSFRALQIDLEAKRAQLAEAEIWFQETTAKHDALLSERDALSNECAAMRETLKKTKVLDPRSEATYLAIVGALLKLVLNPRPGRDSNAAVIRELLANYDDKFGISKTTLENKFAAATRQLNSN